MLQCGDSFDGCAGLEDVQSFNEWIEFERSLREKYKSGYVPSKVFLAVRRKDDFVVGMIDFRHPLSDFLKNFGFQYSVFLNHFQFDILGNRDLSKKWRKLYGTDMERNVSGGKYLIIWMRGELLPQYYHHQENICGCLCRYLFYIGNMRCVCAGEVMH